MVIKMFQKKKEKKISSLLKKRKTITVKEQLLSIIYFEVLGFILCLITLFILTGGKNYFKLYKELKNFINAYDDITTNYYKDVDKKEIVNDAIQSMIDKVGDDYTTFSDKDETTNFKENIDGIYKGIGCTIATNKENQIYVVEIFENSPAQKAGLKENDIIVKIDNQDLTGKTSSEMSEYIKNNKNAKIKLTIMREEKEKEITIERGEIEVPSVISKIITKDKKKIGYIQISIFSSVTYNQFNTKLKKLEKQNIQALIIDVRNNTGGYLTSVTDISSLFLEKGKIIYQLENEKEKEVIKDKTKEKRTYPISIIINVGSASASEILAASFKESYKSFVVGTNSFGKGTVQKTKQLSDGSMIKYTIEKWLTPSGEWINEKGVTPTHFVEYKSAENEEEYDSQITKAIELLMEKIK